MTPPQNIAHYRIVSKLGEGGMGAVYRATDTKLGRDVAIKVIPDTFAGDPDRLARFTREAQVLASLNHPNIAAIYGVEDRALVLELVAGVTLAERIAQGPIPLEEAMPMIRQLIDALEYAHEKGVVHRDLKPANLKISPEGRLKVLDFGLAKALASDAAAADPRSSPTLTMRSTLAGVIMGTAAYMSPEQARGQEVDKRSDIWSFAVLLFEMLTGRALFAASTVSDTLAAVLTGAPDLDTVPAPLRSLLQVCLQRDPRQRLRDIGDARLLLDQPLAPPDAPAPRPRLSLALGILAAAATLAAVTLAVVHFREQPAPLSQTRFEIPLPDKSSFSHTLAVSPDGRWIAFLVQRQGEPRQIWLRAMDSSQARALTGTEYAGVGLIWSPDSRWLAFSSLGQVKKIEVAGGPAQTVCASCPDVVGGAWNREGVILITSSFGGVFRLAEGGGAPTAVIQPASGVRGGLAFLRDGRRFLYSARSAGRAGTGIYIGSLDAGGSQPPSQPLLVADQPQFAYAPSADARHAHILFQRAGALVAQPFEDGSMALSGAAVPVAPDAAVFGASGTGVLAYLPGSAAPGGSQLLWFDRHGKPLGALGPVANYGNLQLAPDGKSVVVDRLEANGVSHVWIGDLARGVFSRLLQGDSPEVAPSVLPDGRVVFTYYPPGVVGDLYVTAANGAGAPEVWLKSDNVKHVNHWSPDSRFLVYDDHNGAQRQDLWILPVDAPAGGSRKPIPFLTTAADETLGQFSRDGKWIAYSSDANNRREVYVQGFAPDRVPAVGPGKWLISTAGGDKPRWSRDGRELFYIANDGKMMAVAVKTSPAFEPGIPVALFDVRTTGFMVYDVGVDGRFLINSPAATAADPSPPITVVLNWMAALQR